MADNDLVEFGETEPTEYEKQHCFCYTFTYRGKDVDIFIDDYGQCFYFYYNKKSYPCGTYNTHPEEYIKYVVDRDLDEIYSLRDVDKKYSGAFIEYANKSHTSIVLKYRGEIIKKYKISKKTNLESIKKDSLNYLDELLGKENDND